MVAKNSLKGILTNYKHLKILKSSKTCLPSYYPGILVLIVWFKIYRDLIRDLMEDPTSVCILIHFATLGLNESRNVNHSHQNRITN